MAIDTQKLIPSSGPSATLSAESVSDLGVIRVGLIDINKALKKSFKSDKKEVEDKLKKDRFDRIKKIREGFLRGAQNLSKGVGLVKKVVPGRVKGFFGYLQNFVSTVFLGWLGLQLLKFLPKLMGLVKTLAAAADFVINWGGKILDGLVGFLKFGEDMYKGLEVITHNVLGDWGVEKLHQVTKLITNIINYTAIAAMIAIQSNLLGNMMGFGKGGIFRRGLGRTLPRFFLRNFKGMGGRTVARSLLGKGIATKTLGAAGATKATTTVAGGAAKVAVPAAIVLGVLGLASALGEGGAQLLKISSGWEQSADVKAREAREKKWWNISKYWDMSVARVLRVVNRLAGGIFGILDVLGTPFRLVIEALRWPFMNEKQKDKAALNLEKFDARIRDQFRKFFNMFDFLNIIPDKEGSWGAMDWHSGKSGTEAMGYDKPEEKTSVVPPTNTSKNASSDFSFLEGSKAANNIGLINSVEKYAPYEDTRYKTVFINNVAAANQNSNQETSSGPHVIKVSSGGQYRTTPGAPTDDADILYKK